MKQITIKTDIFKFKNGDIALSCVTPWELSVSFKKGETIIIDNHPWEIVTIDHIIQGCFGTPINRMHAFKIKPIDHEGFLREKEYEIIRIL